MFAELSERLLGRVELADALGISIASGGYHYRVLERFGGIRAASERRGG